MSDSHQETDREWLDDDNQMLQMLTQAIGESTIEQEVPGYQIISKIDAGAQGTVYQGVRAGSKKEVAVKILHQRTFPTSRTAMRLQREFELAGRLDHAGIVRILDSGLTESGRHFLVMDMLTGGTLRDAVPLGGQHRQWQGWRKTLHGFLKICDAVDHAHKRGVLHRDLKPSNVLFDDHGNPRVADFGLAKDIEKSKTSVGMTASLTRTGELVGSPAYSAPEQFSLTEEDDVDMRSDVYSLGAILYELLCGKLPIPVEGSMLDVLQRLRSEIPPTLSKVYKEQFSTGSLPSLAPKKLPADLDAILRMALAKDKVERYQSVAELATDVRAVLQGGPIKAPRESHGKATWQWIKHHRAAAAGIFVYSTALLAVSVVSWSQANRADSMRQHMAGLNEVVIQKALDSFSKIQGGGKYREELIWATLDELSSALNDFPTDPMLLESRAQCWIHLGSRQRETGNTTGAKVSFQYAISDYEIITRDPDENLDAVQGKSIALVKLGDLLKEDDRINMALGYYERALDLDEWLVKQDEKNIGYWDNLAWSYQRRGDLAAKAENGDLAKEYINKFGSAVDTLKRLDPNRPGTQRAEIQYLYSKVFLAKAENDIDTAVTWSETAAKAAKANYEKDKTNLNNGFQYANSLKQLHSMYVGIKLHDKAEAIVKDSRDVIGELRRNEPGNIDILILDLRFSFLQLSFALEKNGGEAERIRCENLLREALQHVGSRPDLVFATVEACNALRFNLADGENFDVAVEMVRILKAGLDPLQPLQGKSASAYQSLIKACSL